LLVGRFPEVILTFKYRENRLMCFGDPVDIQSPFPIALARVLYCILYYRTSHDIAALYIGYACFKAR